MFLIYDDFKKIYEHKTITGAAAYLRISKQALSRAIKNHQGYFIRKNRWRIVDGANPAALGLFYLDLLRYFLGRPDHTKKTAQELQKAVENLARSLI